MAEPVDTTDAKTRAFFDRRHPAYFSHILHWEFLESTYKGGRDWFNEHIFQYYKEGDLEFGKRRQRAYRFNHTREVVDLVTKYLFKAQIIRKDDAAPAVVQQFWENATLSGSCIDELMRNVATMSSIGGRVALVIDNNLKPTTVDGKAVSVADLKNQKFRIYGYVVPTKYVLDYAFSDDDGQLLWIKLLEIGRDDKDPLLSSGIVLERVRLWTRTSWTLYEEQTTTTIADGVEKLEISVVEVSNGQHNLGFVPVILCDHTTSDNPYLVPSLIDDIAYLDKAIANYLSNLDVIIQDQTFSQLAMPAQGLLPGEDPYDKLVELGSKRVFVYDAGTGSTNRPEYLSPDPKQVQVILSVISKIINEIYSTVGLAGERTKEDNSVGIDNSSGVAKAYDFEKVNALLLAKAASCERVENLAVKIVCGWANVPAPDDAIVEYPNTFDVMRLTDELMTAEALATIQAPIEVRREQMKLVIDKLFPQLAEDLITTLKAAVDKWEDPATLALSPPSAFATKAGVPKVPAVPGTPATPATGGKATTAPSRQGSVTKETPAEK